MHFQWAEHYLQSRVTCQFWRLIVDWYDSHRDGDREAPPINLISRGRECKTVLCALGAVMHVVDVSKFNLEKIKKRFSCHSILNQTWMVGNIINRQRLGEPKRWNKILQCDCVSEHTYLKNTAFQKPWCHHILVNVDKLQWELEETQIHDIVAISNSSFDSNILVLSVIFSDSCLFLDMRNSSLLYNLFSTEGLIISAVAWRLQICNWKPVLQSLKHVVYRQNI